MSARKRRGHTLARRGIRDACGERGSGVTAGSAELRRCGPAPTASAGHRCGGRAARNDNEGPPMRPWQQRGATVAADLVRAAASAGHRCGTPQRFGRRPGSRRLALPSGLAARVRGGLRCLPARLRGFAAACAASRPACVGSWRLVPPSGPPAWVPGGLRRLPARLRRLPAQLAWVPGRLRRFPASLRGSRAASWCLAAACAGFGPQCRGDGERPLWHMAVGRRRRCRAAALRRREHGARVRRRWRSRGRGPTTWRRRGRRRRRGGAR